MLLAGRLALFAAFCLLPVILLICPVHAAEVLIVGDVQYKPIADVVGEIKSAVKLPVSVCSTEDARGKLNSLVSREGARIVIALGKDAVDEAGNLPPSVPVIYGLVIAPVKSARSNMTGVYMATPVSEYVAMVRRYLPSMRKIAVVGSRTLMSILDGSESAQISAYRVNSSSELVNTVERLAECNAFLLLPDISLLTSSVMDNVYLYSYRSNIPLLGISENNVKQGSLFALVFDAAGIGRQIGRMALQAKNGADIDEIQPLPPAEFNLFINTNTARKMGISIPEEMMKKARRIYP